jgi:capsid assembly protease
MNINQNWMIKKEDHQAMSEYFRLNGVPENMPAQQSKPYQVVNDTAIISIHGVLTPELDIFSALFGGTSLNQIRRDVESATREGLNIILDISSGGGTVHSSWETHRSIVEAAKKTSVIAYCSEACSAAYLLASAADKIYASSVSVVVGSIGVISSLIDVSGMNEKGGVKITEITSGKFKGLGSPHKPLSDSDREEVQSQIDYLATLFFQSISKERKISVQTIADFNAKVFIGDQGKKVGLIDGVKKIEDILEEQAGVPKKLESNLKKIKTTNTEVKTMEGSNQDFMAQVNDYIKVNNCSKSDAMKAVIKSDPESHADFIRSSNPRKESQPFLKHDFMQKVENYQDLKNCSFADALKTMVTRFPSEHQEYLEGVN